MSVVALAAALSLAAPAAPVPVSIPGRYFSPAHVTVVAGDQVTWRNSDVAPHDVRAVDGSFDSGVMARFGVFTHGFGAAGANPYYCTIHPFMRGEVDVFGALLAAPDAAVLAGAPLRLSGRAAPGAAVTLERRAGDWERVAGPVAAAADGAFAFTVDAVAGSVYRAVTAAGPSPEVTPAVVAGLAARISVHPRHHRSAVRVGTVPAQPGMVAVLQRYSRERYMWRRIAHARLDRRGRARFVVRRRPGRVRVLVAHTVRGVPLATSRVVRVIDGRASREPQFGHAEHGAPGAGHDDGSEPRH